MKKILILTIILFNNVLCGAQNIIPNSSFEQYYGCPNYYSQFDSLKFWFNPSDAFPTPIATPDYYNSCDTTNNVGVPNNSMGYQNAHSGLAYSGLLLYVQYQLNYREYIEVPLNFPLVANNCYQLEMYVNLADFSDYTTYELGVYFSDTIVTNLTSNTAFQFIPQINNVAINVFDTLNWLAVSGTYIANGGENYIIIGNFKDNSNTPVTTIGITNNPYAYVYIDDVCLTSCGNSCLTSIEENNSIDIAMYPNPFNEVINLTINEAGNFEINLYDVAGRIVLNQKIEDKTSINTMQFEKGIYFYELVNNKKIMKIGKVVKN